MKFIKWSLICLYFGDISYALDIHIQFQNLMNFRHQKHRKKLKYLKQESRFSLLVFCELISQSDDQEILQELNGDFLIRSKNNFQSLGVIGYGKELIHSFRVWEIDDTKKRAILLIKFELKNRQSFYLLINHWPSQRSKTSRRLGYLKKLEYFLNQNLENPLIILGDFNTNDRELLLVEKSLKKFGLRNPFKGERTYFFAPYGRLYSFDYAFIKGVHYKGGDLVKDWKRKIRLGQNYVEIPYKKVFDHFGIRMNLSINR